MRPTLRTHLLALALAGLVTAIIFVVVLRWVDEFILVLSEHGKCLPPAGSFIPDTGWCPIRPRALYSPLIWRSAVLTSLSPFISFLCYRRLPSSRALPSLLALYALVLSPLLILAYAPLLLGRLIVP